MKDNATMLWHVDDCKARSANQQPAYRGAFDSRTAVWKDTELSKAALKLRVKSVAAAGFGILASLVLGLNVAFETSKRNELRHVPVARRSVPSILSTAPPAQPSTAPARDERR